MNIIISGASRGLGKALKEHFAKKNIVGDFSRSAGVDITDWGSIDKAVKKFIEDYGGVDVLINNAAVNYSSKIEDFQPHEIQNIFNVNVVGALFLTNAVVRNMKELGRGYIININSSLGLIPSEQQTLYGGTKWALTGITKILQAELDHHNIKVTGLHLGALERSMIHNGATREEMDSLRYSEVAETIDFILSRKDTTGVTELGIHNVYG